VRAFSALRLAIAGSRWTPVDPTKENVAGSAKGGRGVRLNLNHLGIVGLVVICSFMAVFVFLFAQAVFVSSEPVFLTAILGAFAGALFAFLFVRLAEGMTKHFDRKRRNLNALVRIQHHLNDYLNRIGENDFIMEGFLGPYTVEVKGRLHPNVYMQRLKPFPIDKEPILDLTNLDFINDLFGYYEDLLKLTDSMETVNDMYRNTVSSLVQQKAPAEMFEERLSMIRPNIKELREFFEESTSDTELLLAKAVQLAEEQPFLNWLSKVFTRMHYSKRFKEKLPSTLRRIQTDRKDIMEASREKIRRVKRRASEEE